MSTGDVVTESLVCSWSDVGCSITCVVPTETSKHWERQWSKLIMINKFQRGLYEMDVDVADPELGSMSVKWWPLLLAPVSLISSSGCHRCRHLTRTFTFETDKKKCESSGNLHWTNEGIEGDQNDRSMSLNRKRQVLTIFGYTLPPWHMRGRWEVDDIERISSKCL